VERKQSATRYKVKRHPLDELMNQIIDNQMMNVSPPILIHPKSKAVKWWQKVPWKRLYSRFTRLSP